MTTPNVKPGLELLKKAADEGFDICMIATNLAGQTDWMYVFVRAGSEVQRRIDAVKHKVHREDVYRCSFPEEVPVATFYGVTTLEHASGWLTLNRGSTFGFKRDWKPSQLLEYIERYEAIADPVLSLVGGF